MLKPNKELTNLHNCLANKLMTSPSTLKKISTEVSYHFSEKHCSKYKLSEN